MDDVFVYKLAADDFMVCVNAANREKDFAWMVANNPHGADIVDEGDQWSQVAIQGPNGVHVTQALADGDVSEMKRHQCRMGTFAGVDGCLIARTGYTGEDGFEVFIPADLSFDVWPAILEAGADYGILPIGLGARDTLRLEAGNCLYGHELNDDTTPLAAGLGWITKLRKPGGFVGSDQIAARRESDPRQLVRLVMKGKRIPREGMDVLHDGAVIGVVTSGTKGPSVGCGVAMAFVDRGLTAAGTVLTIDVRGRHELAEVVKGPSFL